MMKGSAKDFLPHLLMTLNFLMLAVFIVFLQSVISGGGFRPLVFLFYEHLISTILLSTLAFLYERKKRPALTLKVFLLAFFIGFLQIPLAQLLLTSSLGYISATLETIVLNTGSAVTLLTAVIFGREVLSFFTVKGQAKFWGIMLSVAGAVIMVLWTGPRLGVVLSSPTDFGDRAIGSVMIAGAMFAGVFASLLVEHVATKYPAELSLSAMMCFSGTIQTAVIAGLTERRASFWKISFQDNYMEIGLVLYGGIVVTGLSYYVQTWCTHKKGPVFGSAFSPLLIVFSFILDTLVLKKEAHLGSILGAVFIIGGLYLALWSKANDRKPEDELITSCLLNSGSYEQLS